MKWLRIKDYIFPIDKILHLYADEKEDIPFINIMLMPDDSYYFRFSSREERDAEFERIYNLLQW